MRKKKKLFRLLTNIYLRQEDFGGLIFVPITGEILQLNHVGYKLLERVKEMDIFQIIQEDSYFWQELEKSSVIKEVISNVSGKY